MLPIRLFKNALGLTNEASNSNLVTWKVEIDFEKVPWEGIPGEPELLTEIIEVEAEAQPDEDFRQLEGFEEKVQAAFKEQFETPAFIISGNYSYTTPRIKSAWYKSEGPEEE